jgi:hypothetical protein
MPVIITSRKDGFRRAGLAHPAQAVTHPDGRFTPGQIEALRAERMLVVQVIPAAPEEPEGKNPADMTVVELKALLDERKVAYPDKALKAELVALAAQAPAGGRE